MFLLSWHDAWQVCLFTAETRVPAKTKRSHSEHFFCDGELFEVNLVLTAHIDCRQGASYSVWICDIFTENHSLDDAHFWKAFERLSPHFYCLICDWQQYYLCQQMTSTTVLVGDRHAPTHGSHLSFIPAHLADIGHNHLHSWWNFIISRSASGRWNYTILVHVHAE